MHRTSGRWKLGLAYSLITAACWGVLPLILKPVVQVMDPYTLTWYRFAIAAAVLAVVMGASGGLPRLSSLNRQGWTLLGVAVGGLVGNYVLYVASLLYISPAVAQVVIQLGPMFFLLGGVAIMKEHFSRTQWVGFAILILGLLVFFNRRLPLLLDLSKDTGWGVILLLLAAITWAAYGMSQKQLLKNLKPQQILLLVYLFAVLVLLPKASLGAVHHLDPLHWWLLGLSCANTLIARWSDPSPPTTTTRAQSSSMAWSRSLAVE